MANELMIPGGDVKLTLPAHIAARFKPEDSNLVGAGAERVPSLTITGKVFTITADGEQTPLMRNDEEGNEYPVANLPVVILDYAAKPGRSYYESVYNPNEVKEPTCWSTDGVAPDDAVPEKQSPKCANCPMAVKGSSITDSGKGTTACAQHRILALVPVKRLDLPPMRLRISQTSNYDGRSAELKAKGFYAFSNYVDAMRTRGIPHTASIVTNVSFDPTVPYPKLLFKANRFTTEEEGKKVDAILSSGKLEGILGQTGTMTIKANPVLAAPAKQAALPAPATVRAQPAPAAAPEADGPDAEELELRRLLAAAKAKKAKAAEDMKAAAEAEAARVAAAKAKREAEAKAKAEAEAKANISVEDEDDEEGKLLAQLLAKKAAKDKAKALEAGAADVGEAPAKPKPRLKPKVEELEATGEKFLPNALSGNDMGGDEDEGPGLDAAPAKPAAAAPKKSTAKVIEAKPLQLPSEVEGMLTTWDD